MYLQFAMIVEKKDDEYGLLIFRILVEVQVNWHCPKVVMRYFTLFPVSSAFNDFKSRLISLLP